jgi:hypothetical protein
MDKDHLEQLQNTLASLAFTPHFNMATWAQPVDTPNPEYANPCGTSLCLAGLATMLDLSLADSLFQPSVQNLSNEYLYPELGRRQDEHKGTLYFVSHAAQFLGIPYDHHANIWHHSCWPIPLRILYSPKDIFDTWPQDKTGKLNAVYQAYLNARPHSNAANYSLPVSYFRALSGYLALETVYRFQDVRDGDWAAASRENIDAMTFTSYTKPTVLNYWFIYYAPKITQFEQIALNTPSAQSFLKGKPMVE